MDIVDILLCDHVRLRMNMVRIRRAMPGSDVRDMLRAFISQYEMHESIEDEILFPALHGLPEEELPERTVSYYTTTHELIWTHLEQFVDSLNRARPEDLERVYIRFSAAVEAHLRNEEKIFFPLIRQALERRTLEILGRRAELRISRFAVA